MRHLASLDPAVGAARIDGARRSPPSVLTAWAAWLFYGYLYFAIVGPNPFASRNFMSDYTTSDSPNQLMARLASAVLPVLLLLFWNTALAVVKRRETWMALSFCSYAFISCAWSLSPAQTFRGAFYLTGNFLVAAIFVRRCGAYAVFSWLYSFLVVLLFVDFVSVFLIGNAVHSSSELDQQLVGNWRGVFFHKNTAAAVTGATIIFAIFKIINKFKWFDVAVFCVAALFLAGTSGKSAINTAFLASIVLLAMHVSMISARGRSAVVMAAFFLFILGAIALVLRMDDLIETFSNPRSFTGRVAIWSASIAYLSDHPFLGTGYKAFWQLGALTPILKYAVGDSWVYSAAHAHNGYLEIWLTTGLAGLLLSLSGFLATPVRVMLRAFRASRPEAALFLGLTTYIVLLNFLEAFFADSSVPVWNVFMIVSAMAVFGYPNRLGYSAPRR